MLVIFRPGPDTAQCELVLTLVKPFRVFHSLEENQTGGDVGIALGSLKSLYSLLSGCAH